MLTASLMGSFERVGHRGIPAELPENTLGGFMRALERGADAVELDVHVTKDGVVVVHHDFDVSESPIADTRREDLSALDGGADIPTLEDVLKAIGDRANVYIELKGQRIEERVIAVARRHGRRFALHSFDHDAIERVAKRAPDIARGVLVDRGVSNPVQTMRRVIDRVHPRDIWPHWSLVNRDLVQAAHDMGARVIAWTVNSAQTARHLHSLGADGLCTDDVRLLANL